jgi:hypothetical protein
MMRVWTRSGRCGDGEAVGQTRNQPFPLSFDSSLNVDFQGSHVTSDGGLALVRELDERLDVGKLIKPHLAARLARSRTWICASVAGPAIGYAPFCSF